MMNLILRQNSRRAQSPGDTFEQNLDFIKKTIKKKIATYEPLDFNTAFTEFVESIRGEDYKSISEMPGNCRLEEYLEDLIKGFLIERTYFHFLFEAEDLVLKFVVDILKKNSIPLDLSQDITLFVREKLEDKNKPAKIKESFKEGSKLKTYFYAMTRNAVMDYERKYNARVELQDSSELDKIKSPAPAPHWAPEGKEIKERVERLDPQAKIAFKLYYYESITNFSAIAGTLGTSRHKAKKILEKAVDKVLKGVV